LRGGKKRGRGTDFYAGQPEGPPGVFFSGETGGGGKQEWDKTRSLIKMRDQNTGGKVSAQKTPSLGLIGKK